MPSWKVSIWIMELTCTKYNTFSACLETETRCVKSSLCIPIGKVCDGSIDCPDMSDEFGCYNFHPKSSVRTERSNNEAQDIRDQAIVTALHPFLHMEFFKKFIIPRKEQNDPIIACNPRNAGSECGPCASCACQSGAVGLNEKCYCRRTPFDKIANLFKSICWLLLKPNVKTVNKWIVYFAGEWF